MTSLSAATKDAPLGTVNRLSKVIMQVAVGEKMHWKKRSLKIQISLNTRRENLQIIVFFADLFSI